MIQVKKELIQYKYQIIRNTHFATFILKGGEIFTFYQLSSKIKQLILCKGKTFFVIPGGVVLMTEIRNIQGGGFLPFVDGNKKIIVACALGLGNLYGDDKHARDDCLMFLG